MRNRYGYIDPSTIMGVVVSLIILAVGAFAFFTTMTGIEEFAEETNNSEASNSGGNIISTGNQIFSIMGVVLVIGAIMAVIGVVYNYVGRDYSSNRTIDMDTERRRFIFRASDDAPEYVNITSYEQVESNTTKSSSSKTKSKSKDGMDIKSIQKKLGIK